MTEVFSIYAPLFLFMLVFSCLCKLFPVFKNLTDPHGWLKTTTGLTSYQSVDGCEVSPCCRFAWWGVNIILLKRVAEITWKLCWFDFGTAYGGGGFCALPEWLTGSEGREIWPRSHLFPIMWNGIPETGEKLGRESERVNILHLHSINIDRAHTHTSVIS